MESFDGHSLLFLETAVYCKQILEYYSVVFGGVVHMLPAFSPSV